MSIESVAFFAVIGRENTIMSMDRRTLSAEAVTAAFNQICAHLDEDAGELDAATRKRLERIAKESMEAHPALAWQTLGMLAAERWDGEALEVAYANALRCERGVQAAINCAVALAACNRFGEAAEVAERAWQAQPSSLLALRGAIDMAWQAGRWARALELMEALNPRSNATDRETEAYRRKAVAILEQYAVPLSVVETLHDAVYDFLATRRVRALAACEYVDDGPGEETVYVTVQIARERDEVERLDEALTEVLQETGGLPVLSTFCITLGEVETV
jgi:tetratricopeptide (TPR) repeat protein